MAGGAYVAVALMLWDCDGDRRALEGQLVLHLVLIGGVLPILGLIAAFAYRGEDVEPERRCPRCNATLKLHVQVCNALRPRPRDAAGRGDAPGSRLPVS